MKKMFLNSPNPRKAFAGLALTATLAASSAAFGQFIPTGAGSYDYDHPDNWTGGTVNNQFVSTRSLTADQTVFFDSNFTLSSGLTLNDTSTFNRTFIGSGGNRTVTLGGNISLGNSATNANTVTFGSLTAGQGLSVDLGGSSRIFAVGTNRTLEFVNVLSGSGGFTKTGAGILKLSGTANTFTGNVSIGGGSPSAFGGVLEVSKIADSGVASSIGVGSSITFGGSDGAATLRYLGSGDSSNRSFTIGSQGAIFDSSGSGAIQFTNTGNIDVSPSNTVSRTLTFTGTNAGNNSFAGVIRDPSVSATTSVLKTGSGKWILSGANTHKGATTVTAGTLVLGATGSINSSVAVNIAAGATFDTTEKSFTMLGGQEFNFTLDPTAAGSAGMLVAGALDITAGVVDFTILGPLDDDVYVLASYTSLTGTSFASVTAPSGYTIDYAYNGGTQIALVVPEPGTIGLLTGGLCAVMIFGRKRRENS
jgi:autotransporter-associated beta strand protein